MCPKDYIMIFLKSIILNIIFILIAFTFTELLNFNIKVSSYICNVSEIPYDFVLGMWSFGFANNIVILMTIFELGFGIYIINKIANVKFYINIKNFIINF